MIENIFQLLAYDSSYFCDLMKNHLHINSIRVSNLMWLGMIDVLQKGDVGKNVLPQCYPITYPSTV